MTWQIIQKANIALKSTSSKPDPWLGSVFEWIKRLPPAARGKAGAALVAEMLRAFGYSVGHGTLAQSFVVKTHVIKVKLSMAWNTSADSLTFQQIEDDPYTHLAMLGLQPADAWFWICPKSVVLHHSTPQHKKPSRWIHFAIGLEPTWLAAHGGGIARARAACSGELGAP
jgi:hypothetical protein